MKKSNKLSGGKSVALFASFSLLIGLVMCIRAQFPIANIRPIEFNLLNAFIMVTGVICVAIKGFELLTNREVNRNRIMYIGIAITAVLGSSYSFCYIFEKMGYFHLEYLPLNNDTSFTSVYFFALYTFIYNGFIIDWCDNIEIKLTKFFMLAIIEVPNLISWWWLIYIAPLSFVEENSQNHFWMTFFFALSIVLFLVSFRLRKKENCMLQHNVENF
ncbi:hypothetical protein JDS82_02520 [Bacillus cereus group sp. N14]|uniref:hypothetical protein n=1 Tax=Bacillus cereus group sp. N14 TaxID=2794587 RepID=UPI0018F6E391|nr:hypothetical protein [Bacillus cereus group sp. N14]MBJ8080095.1 hypothetical protein [Bacillus cereus group sp. N14]